VLGAREQNILLSAPPWDDSSKVIPPPRNDRATDEAHRRAIRKLSDVGLLWLGWQRVQNPQTRHDYHKRAVWLTPLGEAVVSVLRQSLSTGRPIRWAGHIAQLLTHARRDAATLLVEFRQIVAKEQTRQEGLRGYMGTAVSVGGDREYCLQQLRKGALTNNLNNFTCVARGCSSSRRGIRYVSSAVATVVRPGL
jgi:hypothetical protein